MNFLMAAFGNDPDIQFIRFGQINKCKVQNMKGIGLVLKDKECQSRIDYMSNPDFAKNIDVLFYASNRPFAARESLSLNAIREFKTGNPDAKIVSMLGYFMTEKNCSQLYNDTKTTKSCVDPNNVIASPKSDKTDPLYTKFMDITDAVVDRSKFLCSTDFPYDCESETPEGIIMMLDQSHHTFEFAAYTGRKFADQNPRFFHDLIEKPSYK